jgi:hypothetical protein
MSNAIYLRPGMENEKTAADQLSEENTSARSRYNEMAVICNTISEEDLKDMQEDGFSIEDMDSRTIVTVTDKIKAALAKAGVDISEYGDTLSEEQLEEITGSSAVAQQIVAALHAQDLPATGQNVQDMADAAEKINQMNFLGDDAIVYLVKNEMPPTIENVYRAIAAGTAYTGNEASIASGMTGKAAANMAGTEISEADFEQLRPQIEKIIQEAGLDVDEETVEDSRFLIQKGILLTADNISYLQELKGLSEQLSEGNLSEDMLSSMCDAIEEGGRPLDAMLIKGYSIRDRAEISAQVVADATEEDLAYLIADEKELTIENLQIAEQNRGRDTETEKTAKQLVTEQGLALLTAKRQLEEVRLAMTSEANYALLKKGISIDTKPLIELVDDLKNQENQYYKDLLASEGLDTEDNIAVFKETDEVVADLKSAPAYVIKPQDPDTLRSLHQEGMALKERLDKANESYETLMTTPRKDMGDSMQKAFRNVDDILTELDLETSEANRRAVRILAYNRTELTPENIAQVKEKDEEVQRAFSNLTPKVTMEMIKKGINPIDMDMEALNQAAEEIKSEIGDEDTERYQKYLWKLEQNQEITQEERSSYIGIYRLIAQVERADHAAIGSLMQQGAQITMRTLLTAVRTEKKKSVDYRVDDQFSGVESNTKNARIDDQINASYYLNCVHDAKEKMTPQAAEQLSARDYENMSPEQVKEVVEEAASEEQEADEALEQQYLREQMEDFSEILATPEEVYEFLERANIPNTMNNLLAAREMMRNRNQMFETLWSAEGASEDAMERIEEMKAQVLKQFGEAVKSPKEMADAQETLADVAEHVMDTMIIENEHNGTIDLKALRLMNTQFSICAKQAKQESYMIPIQTEDGVTGVSLKIVRGEKKKGMVDILFGGISSGKVAASFEAKENGISGMLITDQESTRRSLSEHLGILAEALRGTDGEAVDLRVAKVNDDEMTRYENRVAGRHTDTADGNVQQENEDESGENDLQEASAGEEYHVQSTRLYHIAESFIQTVQKFL